MTCSEKCLWVETMWALWWLLAHFLLSASWKYLTSMNISHKIVQCNLWETGGIGDGWPWRPEAGNEFEVDETTHIVACDISPHHQSPLFPPVNTWPMDQQTLSWKWTEHSPDKSTHSTVQGLTTPPDTHPFPKCLKCKSNLAWYSFRILAYVHNLYLRVQTEKATHHSSISRKVTVLHIKCEMTKPMNLYTSMCCIHYSW